MAKRAPDRKNGTIVLFVFAFLLGVGYVLWLVSGTRTAQPTATVAATPSVVLAGPTRTLRPTRTPQPVPTSQIQPQPGIQSQRKRVGIVAGHWQNDSGAVCPDGLQEVDINVEVASRVVFALQEQGYEAELLAEFSEKLPGYVADAFVSIHTDSCDVPGVSGFKVARVAASAIPEQEDQLVACLTQAYAEETGLSFHSNSISFDMTDYHAFRAIDPNTPGAIIELGFMDADRKLLTEDAGGVAQGVVEGIICFLEGE